MARWRGWGGGKGRAVGEAGAPENGGRRKGGKYRRNALNSD